MYVNENREFDSLVDDFIKEERNTAFNPFLATRIMSEIEKAASGSKAFFSRLENSICGVKPGCHHFAGILLAIFINQKMNLRLLC